jgi:hypothetical protein
MVHPGGFLGLLSTPHSGRAILWIVNALRAQYAAHWEIEEPSQGGAWWGKLGHRARTLQGGPWPLPIALCQEWLP